MQKYKKKIQEIEDKYEFHLLNKYCLLLNQKKKPIYCKIKCIKRKNTNRKKDAIQINKKHPLNCCLVFVVLLIPFPIFRGSFWW